MLLVPLFARMCPSDTYKVYKQGSNVRIDTTLLGFDHTNWQRGNRSYIFQGQGKFVYLYSKDLIKNKVPIGVLKVLFSFVQLLEATRVIFLVLNVLKQWVKVKNLFFNTLLVFLLELYYCWLVNKYKNVLITFFIHVCIVYLCC